MVELVVGCGGMAATTRTAPATSAALVGRSWGREVLDLGCRWGGGAPGVQEPGGGVPAARGGAGGHGQVHLPPLLPRYRQALVLGFFLKFFLTVEHQLRWAVQGMSSSGPSPGAWSPGRSLPRRSSRSRP